MTEDQEHSSWGVPVYRTPEGPPPRRPTAYRDRGLRRVRRGTNWVIAFVLVAIGATSAELGHVANATHSVSAVAPPAVGAPVAVSGGSTPAPSPSSRAPAPALSAPIAVSGGS